MARNGEKKLTVVVSENKLLCGDFYINFKKSTFVY